MNVSECKTTNATNFTYYANSSYKAEYILITINHQITNLLDEYNAQVMTILIFALYFYQCIKIHTYTQKQNKAIEFQILFCIWTLIRILQLSYGKIGNAIDNTKQWKLKVDDQKINQIYCDPQLRYFIETCEKCYVRYEINQLILSINYFFNIIVVQMITFFWYNWQILYRQWQISPQMFLRPNYVLMNQYVPKGVKVFYLVFIAIDLLLFSYYFLVWFCTYYKIEFQLIVLDIQAIVQIISSTLTLAYFCYHQFVQISIGEKLYPYQRIAVVSIGCFFIFRIFFLFDRYLDPDNDYTIDRFQRTTLLYIFFYKSSLLYILYNILDFQQRICLIQIF